MVTIFEGKEYGSGTENCEPEEVVVHYGDSISYAFKHF